MIPIRTISKRQAQNKVNNIYEVNFDRYRTAWEQRRRAPENVEQEPLNEEILRFRDEIVETFWSEYAPQVGSRDLYRLDLTVGLKLFSLLKPQEMAADGLSNVLANNDDFWRWISVEVFPDITYLRYPDPIQEDRENGRKINSERFYAGRRRIWLKTLWWFIYLSWQGDLDSTRAVLADNGVDDINKLLETPGRGYRVDIYRCMMRQYGNNVPIELKSGHDFFAKMTQLNNAKCVAVEPAFFRGGIEGYVSSLIEQIRNSEVMG